MITTKRPSTNSSPTQRRISSDPKKPSTIVSLSPRVVPLWLHGINLAFIGLVVAICRWDPVLSVLKKSAAKWKLGYHGHDHYNNFQPLSIQAWIAHAFIMVFGVEVVGAFVMRGLKASNDLSMPPLTRRMFRVQAMANLISHIFSILPFVSHAIIRVPGCEHLEAKLMDVFFFGTRTHTFGIGLAMLFGPWAYFAVGAMCYLWEDLLLYHLPVGISLSTVTLLVTLWHTKDLSWIFQVGICLTMLSPFIVPDSTNDQGHTEAAAMIALSFAIQAVGLGSSHERM